MAKKQTNPKEEIKKTEEITLESGTYDIIRNRLLSQGKDLQARVEKLNSARKEIFGSIESKLLGTNRITTENNCVPRDMVPIGSHFIFAYNVHVGLRSEIKISDVFSIYNFEDHSFHKESIDLINDERFLTDFKNLYRYYRKSQFIKFSEIGHYLYMVFQIGKQATDIKVFKWLIENHKLKYIDNRSEQEFKYPAQHEFEWIRAHRDFHREGLHPHVSIADRVFVEAVGGDLTIKIEDNTDSGEGIYSEPVQEKEQTLDDAEYFYALLGNLIIIKIRPYQEKDFRYFVFNEKVKQVKRIDSIEDACVLLPEDHGIIFPNGYYLQSGTFKVFDHALQNLVFNSREQSPNGEDYLYIFHNRKYGTYILLSYNVIEQKVDIPIICHGYAHFSNGEMVYFKSEEDPLKHHAVQIWQTPYVSSDFTHPVSQKSHLYKIGNKDIVRCMSECYEVFQLTNREDSYANLYHDLVKRSRDVLDSYFWLADKEAFELNTVLEQIHTTASSALDEFEKVSKVRKNSNSEITRVKKQQSDLLGNLKKARFKDIDKFVHALSELRSLRGEIISLKDLRYVDIKLTEKMEIEVAEASEKLSNSCVEFLLKPKALDLYKDKVVQHRANIPKVEKGAEAKEVSGQIDKTASELDLLIEIVSNLKIEDPTKTTQIIDSISEIYSELNHERAGIKKRVKELRGTESIAEFNSQVKLLNQGMINYLDISDTIQKCDEFLNKLIVQLEELEGKFIDFDEFVLQLSEKREEIYNAFESKKLALTEVRSKRATALFSAADRILKGIHGRVGQLKTVNDINGYFASDLMIDKVRDIVKGLVEIDDSVKADDIQTRLKTIKEDAIRQLKDRQELYLEGEDVIKFGTHHFSVNVQTLDVSIIARDGRMYFHLSGTNFFEEIQDESFNSTKAIWNQDVVSQNQDVYRAEYLAYKLLQASKHGDLIPVDELADLNEKALLKAVQQFMGRRYEEGYVKGVHDSDASKILKTLITIEQKISLLHHPPEVRACAAVYWNKFSKVENKQKFEARLQGIGFLNQLFPNHDEGKEYISDLENAISNFIESSGLFEHSIANDAAIYLFQELTADASFIISKEAADLYLGFRAYLKKHKKTTLFDQAISKTENDPAGKYELIRSWVSAFSAHQNNSEPAGYIQETAAIIFCDFFDKKSVLNVSLNLEIGNLIGEHRVIQDRKYELNYLAFQQKLKEYESYNVPLFEKYSDLKKSLTAEFKNTLRLDDFKPKVMTSFVRNRLIDKVYLPLVGDNLAKQIGVVGEQKRTDRMGLLLLISPPGYGKTTLMEYIANRLGIIFMKINGPAIGHRVTSLDPAEATNASAREELEKLNLSFEMGDNVMIYVDDIQHCNPEFLQKFISLCDAQRRIEGVYKNNSKAYDLRGKKVAVVMAGNPYTESGEKFQIPDMLANRADTYNLGDIIGDSRDVFILSYLENCLTSNPVLNKVANKSRNDIYTFIQIAETNAKEGLDLEANYSVEETNEIINVIKKLLVVRDIVLNVNQEYIRSASQADAYRTEPPFKLQGSYRNMNKIAEKVLPVMNDEELKTLILSNYIQDAQTLTTGAESNLLKFRELNGFMTEEDLQRWEDIKKTFRKNLMFGSVDSDDSLGKIMVHLSSFTDGLDGIRDVLEKKKKKTLSPKK